LNTNSETTDDGVFDEVEEYVKEPPLRMDVLNYWSQNAKYPKLREVAFFLFAIPVSSVSSERLGSSLNNTLQQRRASLDSEKVDDMLFIKSNKDLKKG